MMKARALICDASQHFSIEEVTLPEPGPGQILVKARKSGVSIGTEFALIRNKISWGPYPLCVGYQAVGLVEEVGAGVEEFRPGDRVYYRGGSGMRLADGTAVSCVSGTHCSHALISTGTTHGAAHLPDGVEEEQASLFVMPAVALFGVDLANVRMGSTVVVYGCGQIGLGVVAFCARRGAVVLAVDLSAERLEVAKKLGADVTVNAGEEDVLEAVHRVASAGADVVFEATGIPACIDQAIPLARPFGSFVMQGNYGADPISFHFLPPHGKRLTWHFPCDDGLAPCRRAVMKNLLLGALDWGPVITHRVPARDAARLYEAINTGEEKNIIGAVIDWSE